MTTTITPEQADTIPAEANDLDALGELAKRLRREATAFDNDLGSDPEADAGTARLLREAAGAIDLARRAAVPSEQGEAVAWVFELAQARHQRTGEWVHFGPPQLSFTKPNVPDGSIRNLCPLVRPAPAAVVKVKPLEWSDNAARGIVGLYRIHDVTGFLSDPRYDVWLDSSGCDEDEGVYLAGEFGSWDEAADAAQADYEARIRSALE